MAHSLQINWKRAACLALVVGLALIGGASRVTQAAPAAPNLALLVTRGDDPAPTSCAVGDCSLREAVNAANASGGADTINIAPAVTAIVLGCKSIRQSANRWIHSDEWRTGPSVKGWVGSGLDAWVRMSIS